MIAKELVKGGKYNWQYQPKRLIYLGKHRGWFQFALVEQPNEVWCEVLESKLYMIEESI